MQRIKRDFRTHPLHPPELPSLRDASLAELLKGHQDYVKWSQVIGPQAPGKLLHRHDPRRANIWQIYLRLFWSVRVRWERSLEEGPFTVSLDVSGVDQVRIWCHKRVFAGKDKKGTITMKPGDPPLVTFLDDDEDMKEFMYFVASVAFIEFSEYFYGRPTLTRFKRTEDPKDPT